ncbi:hypothetical protein VDGL01_11760 [Verticillium dahliae]
MTHPPRHCRPSPTIGSLSPKLVILLVRGFTGRSAPEYDEAIHACLDFAGRQHAEWDERRHYANIEPFQDLRGRCSGLDLQYVYFNRTGGLPWVMRAWSTEVRGARSGCHDMVRLPQEDWSDQTSNME